MNQKMTSAQKELARKHGTPEEFEKSVRNCYEITYKEAMDAIDKYRREWYQAGEKD